ncbi:MAG TPA: phosphoribosylamine--glycine ligase family protein, partial [Dysgonamonadaceae bacterium]|nr:phosphoribosylamine--glycine ligase family protein [Dysgonamonadaceae bacterium]
MNVLLLGSGGREHALAWKIRQSRELTHLYIAPGNAGTATVGQNVPISVTDFAAIKKFSLENDIDMVVVGPEDPLVQGIYDYFDKDEDICHISVI